MNHFLYIYKITSYYNKKLNIKYVTNNLLCYTEDFNEKSKISPGYR